MTAKLPVGLQDFAQLREAGALYADKTELIHRLVTSGWAYFLSRPRRFGKSLLISTLKELYEGNEALFQGLWIHPHWDWGKRWPVVRISLGTGNFRIPGGTRERFVLELAREAGRHGVSLPAAEPSSQFGHLLAELSARGPRPVVLIDEYDKPVLQVLEQGDVDGLLDSNRQELRAFYSCLKDAAPHFLLMTGVSRLTKASVFSEMNHLRDITWDRAYADLCGLTHAEMRTTFAEAVDGLAQAQGMDAAAAIARLQDQYNGFRFASGVDTVFNPFSTLTALASASFGSYWTQTGTPEFLVRLMRDTRLELADVDGVSMPTTALESLDPLRPEALPLLLQTGYLTIVGGDAAQMVLGFPNQEVRHAFVDHLVRLGANAGPTEIAPRAQRLGKALLAGDLDRFIREMQWVFSALPYQLDDATEKRYHGLFHAMTILAVGPLGLVQAEVPNALGRCDLVIDLPERTWIVEFKRDGDTAAALAQIAQKEYARVWTGRGKPVELLAVTFGSQTRNIVAWERRPG